MFKDDGYKQRNNRRYKIIYLHEGSIIEYPFIQRENLLMRRKAYSYKIQLLKVKLPCVFIKNPCEDLNSLRHAQLKPQQSHV